MEEMMPGSSTTVEQTTIVNTDDKLITAARMGDEEAFGVLFERHKNAVYSFVRRTVGTREDAEDIVQETFCRAWRSMTSFRGESKLLTWLCRIAANLCVDYRRSPGRRIYTNSDTEVYQGLNNPLMSPRAGSMESGSIARQALLEALDTLPTSHRMLVILCDVQGFTCEEAAQVLQCSSISVRVRLSRARKKLRSILSGFRDEVD
jgi:RNA polymerase sigma-70 factor (ECF subfamily)